MHDSEALAAPRPSAPSLTLSRLGWGLWRLRGDGAHTAQLAHAALDAGISLFDTADIYGVDAAGFGSAEAALGDALQRDPGLRSQIVVATKGGIFPGVPYISSAAHLVQACEASLRRLRIDAIDLYQIHRPDFLTHPYEVATALDQLRSAGKIREAGVSNYSHAQARALAAYMPFSLTSTQPELSALALESLTDGVLDFAMECRMAVLAWSPLAGGKLGAIDPNDARAVRVAAALDTIATRENVSRAAAAVAWVLAHPSQPTALIGTQNPQRFQELADGVKITLTHADWYQVVMASRGGRIH